MSPDPFGERWVSRVSRVISRIARFFFLLKKDKSIRIVHINTAYNAKGILRDTLFIGMSYLLRKKIILQIHSEIRVNDNTRFTNWLAGRAFRLCDRILVYSGEDRKRVGIGIPGERIEIFPNAVDVASFQTKNRALKRDLSIPEEGKVVLFLSRMIKEKGGYDLIESIPAVNEHDGNVYFVFAGDGPEKNRMEEVCRQKNIEKQVRFTGHLQNDDLLKAFSCADIFVLPTYSEAMPMVILEALAAGLPIISTRLGAIQQIIKEGINGFLIEAGSPIQLAEKILLLLSREDLVKRMKEENIELAKKEFDREVIMDRLENLYTSL